MGEWEREYARLRTQQAVGPAVNVTVQYYPDSQVMLICRACDEYLLMDAGRHMWVCDCGAAELGDKEIKAAMAAAFEVLSKSLGLDKAQEPEQKDGVGWLERALKPFR